MLDNKFTQYKLCEEIIQALSMLHYIEPTPIQEKVIPLALEGKDIIAKSKTGSGKTAAFAIPICESIVWEENLPQALVLEPTRELAYQVKDEIFNVGRMKRVKVPVVFGGFPFDKQALTLKQKSHIVVGTPGRVLDHCETGTLKCSNVKYVIIDEADLMLDMGFLDDVKRILSYLPENITIMLFSATMGEALYALTDEFMNSPVEVKLEDGTETVDSIEQLGCFVTEEDKYELFLRMLYKNNPTNAMIFCGTREMVEVLYYKLKKEKVWCGMLHGLIDQKQRIHTIDDFRTGGFRYLIATDVAARGVDFDDITHVINYDLPMSKETYVHRIGRTGRNGKSGKAISFIREEEKKMLSLIEKFTGTPIEIVTPPSEEEVREFLYKEKFNEAQQKKQERKKKKGDVFQKDIMKLTISGGRKSKLRTCEVVGTISGIEGVNGKEDIGVIDIRDSITYVEILNGKGNLVLNELPKRTMKGKCRKVSISN
ncbi:DEAD/DEAH box helicase [Lachnoclostridium phytofermentans]|uniref:DEAD/DEAH box helicase domain protein n=1 Tax=Lachnoclostridium phytofermentans (strain ATCC 700394 / DSM 18823 / ISDg) TaxID=357809 RepID=A9KIC2_LACP7|nr:DEAD/DEAH box helicase [Lachnoclostridium phytofermentans]ABX42374.1 DEAD/DEAH box helicase domain protein [Lachnoclostridium phytofermentans ISDg]